MARDGFIYSKFDNLIESLEAESKDFSRHGKALMRKEVRKLQRKTKQQARIVKKVSGKYHSSIKAGKVWSRKTEFGARVYSGAPHAHLLEEGHDQVQNPQNPSGRGVQPGKGIGEVIGHVDGKYVFDRAASAFVPTFEEDVEDMIDDMIRRL